MKTKYIFGFDAGTASGAWSIIDTEENKIVDSGMFPNSTEEKRVFADRLSPFVQNMDAVLEDVIPMPHTMTANIALKGSVMFMEGVLYTLYEGVNIYYVDPAKNTKHPLGCWLKEFGLTDIKIDTAGLDRRAINKKAKEVANETTISIARELFSNADEFLSKTNHSSNGNTSKNDTNKKRNGNTGKTKKPDPNIATSVLIAEFHRRYR